MQSFLKNILDERRDIKRVLVIFDEASGLGSWLRAEYKIEVIGVEQNPPPPNSQTGQVVVADPSQHLPFMDASFDMVIVASRTEELANLYKTMTELQRVTKRRGLLVLKIFNVQRLEYRFFFLFFGGFFLKVKGECKSSHPVFLPDLYELANKAGLRYEYSDTYRYQFLSVILVLVFYPLVALLSSLYFGWRHPLIRDLLSLAWLAGRDNFVLFEKTNT